MVSLNQPIINLIKYRFPGNNINFRDLDNAFAIYINYKFVGHLLKEEFKINIWNKNKIDFLINKLMTKFCMNGELHLHPNMCNLITRDNLPLHINITLLNNSIDFNENMYIVLLEDIETGINGAINIKVGIIQEHEFYLFYPIRFHNKNLITIRKRII